jgi:hypothetical protein
VQPEVSIINERTINGKDPCDVYLCKYSTKEIIGKTTKVITPIISTTVGTYSYHGLYDIGESINVIPYTLYLENKHDIHPIQMEQTSMTIQLDNKEYISPLGIVTDVEVLVGKIKYPTDFIVLGCSQDSFCHIILVDLSYIPLVLKLICLKRKSLLIVLVKR